MPHVTSELSFGDWVRRRRKALDLTQEQLANLVGCSHSAIRKFETGERRPSAQIAELLAAHLDIPDGQRTRFLQVARGDARVEKLHSASSGIDLPSTAQTFIASTNLPATATPFVGRRQDIAALTKLIQDPHCRLITLLGQGGVGKTRLSIHVARQALAAFDARVYFVPLAPLTNPESILPAIASLFGLVTPNTDLKAQLVGYLREKHILLVLDNFEHLIQGADLLNELLIQAPHLKFLVASRERLNLQGEWTLELSGLTLPPEASQPESEVYDALELFEQSVRRVRPELRFTEADRAAAIHICNLVEGLPLAIELAAAWIQVLSCSEIAREIETTFDFLKSSQRNLPERHKSLRAVFEHSWQLLSEEERPALAGLSIFAGGFSRSAAETVAGAALDIFSSLLAKSLIRRAEHGRFDMHEAVRQYAATRLENEHALRGSHARYYLSMLRDLEDALKAGDQQFAVETLTDEFSNIHTAWEWGLENKLYELLIDAIRPLWLGSDLRGRIREGFHETAALIEALRREPDDTERNIQLGIALAYHGMFCYRSGEHLRGRAVLEESIAILRPLNVPQLLSEPLIFSSIIYALTGNLPAAQKNVNEGVAIARQFNDKWFLAIGLFNQGVQFAWMGEHRRAHELMQSALVLWREMGNVRLMGLALNHLSALALEMDARSDAHAYLEESLNLASAYKDRWGLGSTLGRLGVLALRADDLMLAKSYLDRSITVFSELGTRADQAWSLMQLGKLHLHQSEFDKALVSLKEAICLGLESESMLQVYEASMELADCLLNLNRIDDTFTILRALPESAYKLESVRRRAEQVQAEAEGQHPDVGKATEVQSVKFEEVLSLLLKE